MRARQSRLRASYDLDLSFYQVGSFCTIWNDYKEFFFFLISLQRVYQHVLRDINIS